MKKIIILVFICSFSMIIYGQKHDYNWPLGFGFPDTIESPYKGNRVFVMKFGQSELKFDTVHDSYYDLTKQYIRFNGDGTTSFSDKNGNFKYATEGKRIYDASWNVMDNGDTINAGPYWINNKFDYRFTYGTLAVPDPGNSKFSYLLHTTIVKPAFVHILKYTKIDLEANNGLGKVIEKNITIFNNIDSLEQPMVVQHANGRDWWIFCHKYKTRKYYKMLLTPKGFENMGYQEDGPNESPINTGIVTSLMSNKGDKYCRYDRKGIYRICDFDRCSGNLSNFKILSIPDSLLFFTYFCFSPSSKYIYATGQSLETLTNYLTQIDISNEPVTYTIIAKQLYINTTECNGYATLEMGPNGKMYVGSATFSNCINIINKPDEAYPDCEFQEYQYILPFRSGGPGMPHYPNYRLGPLIGSGCDTITSTLDINDHNPIAITYPNPVSESITIELMKSLQHCRNLEVSLIDISGKLLYSGKIPPYAYIHQIDIRDLVPGMYCVLIRDKFKLLGSVKVVKQ